MDTLLLHSQFMASPKPKLKRPCCSPSPSLPSADNQNHIPNSNSNFPRIPDMDSLLESILAVSDSSAVALNCSFDRLLDSRACDSEKADMIDRALKFGSVLLEAAKRSARKRSLIHNKDVWALPSELTIKVFAMLDTQSLCYAAATCSLFRECAVNPACYANIDLTSVTPKVNDAIVSTVIQRAGRSLQSLKLGLVPGPIASSGPSQAFVYSRRSSSDASGISWNDKRSRQGKESSILTSSCLAFLNANGGASGALLKSLRLYNIKRIGNTALCSALSACPSLNDLEMVGLHVELRQTLESVSKYCPQIENLFFESSKTGRGDSLKLPTCSDLVNNCPNLSSLALRGFKLRDSRACELVKGFRKLKCVDFSTSYSISGAFLRNLGRNAGGNLLEVLLLRDCIDLKEGEVAQFFQAILAGDFKRLKHLDISNRKCPASEGAWYRRRFSTSFIRREQLLEVRPDLCFVAEFPPEGSDIEEEQMIANNVIGDDTCSSLSSLSSNLDSSSESSYSSDQGSGNEESSSESSYSSDQGSGNEESQDTSFVFFEESAIASNVISEESNQGSSNLDSSFESSHSSNQGSGNEESQAISFVIFEESADELDFVSG